MCFGYYSTKSDRMVAQMRNQHSPSAIDSESLLLKLRYTYDLLPIFFVNIASHMTIIMVNYGVENSTLFINQLEDFWLKILG